MALRVFSLSFKKTLSNWKLLFRVVIYYGRTIINSVCKIFSGGLRIPSKHDHVSKKMHPKNFLSTYRRQFWQRCRNFLAQSQIKVDNIKNFPAQLLSPRMFLLTRKKQFWQRSRKHPLKVRKTLPKVRKTTITFLSEICFSLMFLWKRIMQFWQPTAIFFNKVGKSFAQNLKKICSKSNNLPH